MRDAGQRAGGAAEFVVNHGDQLVAARWQSRVDTARESPVRVGAHFADQGVAGRVVIAVAGGVDVNAHQHVGRANAREAKAAESGDAVVIDTARVVSGDQAQAADLRHGLGAHIHRPADAVRHIAGQIGLHHFHVDLAVEVRAKAVAQRPGLSLAANRVGVNVLAPVAVFVGGGRPQKGFAVARESQCHAGRGFGRAGEIDAGGQQLVVAELVITADCVERGIGYLRVQRQGDGRGRRAVAIFVFGDKQKLVAAVGAAVSDARRTFVGVVKAARAVGRERGQQFGLAAYAVKSAIDQAVPVDQHLVGATAGRARKSLRSGVGDGVGVEHARVVGRVQGKHWLGGQGLVQIEAGLGRAARVAGSVCALHLVDDQAVFQHGSAVGIECSQRGLDVQNANAVGVGHPAQRDFVTGLIGQRQGDEAAGVGKNRDVQVAAGDLAGRHHAVDCQGRRGFEGGDLWRLGVNHQSQRAGVAEGLAGRRHMGGGDGQRAFAQALDFCRRQAELPLPARHADLVDDAGALGAVKLQLDQQAVHALAAENKVVERLRVDPRASDQRRQHRGQLALQRTAGAGDGLGQHGQQERGRLLHRQGVEHTDQTVRRCRRGFAGKQPSAGVLHAQVLEHLGLHPAGCLLGDFGGRLGLGGCGRAGLAGLAVSRRSLRHQRARCQHLGAAVRADLHHAQAAGRKKTLHHDALGFSAVATVQQHHQVSALAQYLHGVALRQLEQITHAEREPALCVEHQGGGVRGVGFEEFSDQAHGSPLN